MHDPPNKYNIVRGDEKRAQKHEVFFIWCKKECPLSFTERIILSVLVKAERMAGNGITQSKLAAWTGLTRITVRKALREKSRLLKSGLVVRDHYRQWRAVEPSEHAAPWFATRKTKGNHWADRLAYWPVDLGDRTCGHVFECVFHGLLNRLKGTGDAVVHECYESLATLLGCDYRRIKSALGKLVANQVVEVINAAKNRYGNIVRFDIRFKSEAEKASVDVPLIEDEPIDATPEANGQPKAPKPLSHWEQEQVDRIANLRAVRDMIKKRLQSLGWQQWQVGKALWAMDKVPTVDMSRVFHAIVNKHGHSADAVLAEMIRYGERLRRKQRAEARELRMLEAMSQSVTV